MSKELANRLVATIDKLIAFIDERRKDDHVSVYSSITLDDDLEVLRDLDGTIEAICIKTGMKILPPPPVNPKNVFGYTSITSVHWWSHEARIFVTEDWRGRMASLRATASVFAEISTTNPLVDAIDALIEFVEKHAVFPNDTDLRLKFEELDRLVFVESFKRNIPLPNSREPFAHLGTTNLPGRWISKAESAYKIKGGGEPGFHVMADTWLTEMRARRALALDSAQADADLSNGSWSEPRSPSEWAKLFACSWDTLKRRIEEGTIRAKRLSTKSYRIHPDDLPN